MSFEAEPVLQAIPGLNATCCLVAGTDTVR